MEKTLLSTNELAKILGISRQAVFKKIRLGQVKARKIGRNFFIEGNDLAEMLGNSLSEKRKKEIEIAVGRTIKEYGPALKLLGRE